MLVLKGDQSESTTYLGDAGGDSAIIDATENYYRCAYALTAGGTVYAWGSGRLGNGTTGSSNTPVRVLKGAQTESTTYLGDAGGNSKITAIWSNMHSQYNGGTIFAVTAGGAVYSWGYNNYGQLGINSTTDALSPVRVLKGEQSESTTYFGDAGGDRRVR